MKHKKNLPHDYWVAKANEKRKFFNTEVLEAEKMEAMNNTIISELLDDLNGHIISVVKSIAELREKCECPSLLIIECLTQAISDYHNTRLKEDSENSNIQVILYECLSEANKKDKCDYIGKPLLDILENRC